MKWIPLDGKKEPNFDVKMIILLSGTMSWAEVYLKKIEIASSGKEYTFAQAGDSDLEFTSASHFMIPELPKTKE
jgi:hypothetical protein